MCADISTKVATALVRGQRTFADYAAAGFQSDLLPIAHPHCPISPTSELTGDKLGKIPCQMRERGCVGFKDWTQHEATVDDIRRYDVWRSHETLPWGIGIQGRATPAVDIDVDDAEMAGRFHLLALLYLGAAPSRQVTDPETGLVGARRMLPYRSSVPLSPWSIAFDVARCRYMVELKANGQQWVAEGVHPRGGAYGWTDPKSPAEMGREALVEITEAEALEFHQQVLALIEELGGTVVSGSAPRAQNALVPVQQGLLAPSLDAIRGAVAAIPNELHRSDWLRTLASIKAAAGPFAEAIYPDAEDWCLQWGQNDPAEVRKTWDSLRPPFRVGWQHLRRQAIAASNGTYRPPSDFPAIAGDFSPGLAPPTTGAAAAMAMFARYAWVRSIALPIDLKTGDLLKREVFNADNYEVGAPDSSHNSAWAVFLRNGRCREVVQGLTFRPGRGLRVVENLSGLTGQCINTWRGGPALDEAPVSEDEISPWLELARFIVPAAEELVVVLNWLAWVVQNQAEKPNFALVLGSTFEGVGKDMFLEPLRTAIGSNYVREIKPHDLTSRFTGFLRNTKLLIVQEMHSFERREMANLLKPILASPPDSITVELKGRDGYAVPNLVAAVFCTNEANALSIDRTSRRYFVAWCDAEPLAASRYTELREWLDRGGKELVARYLLQRDVSTFNAKGRAPASVGREEMRKAGRTKLDELVEDGIREREGSFRPDIIALEDARQRLSDDVFGRNGRPSPEAFARTLRKHGANRLERLALGVSLDGSPPLRGQGKEDVLYALRNRQDYSPLSKEALRATFWDQRRAATQEAV